MFVISRDLDFQTQRELTLHNKLEMLDFKETSKTQNSTTLEESQSQNEKVKVFNRLLLQTMKMGLL